MATNETVDAAEISLTLRIRTRGHRSGPARQEAVIAAEPRAILLSIPADPRTELAGGMVTVGAWTHYMAGDKADLLGAALSILQGMQKRGWLAELLLLAATNGLLAMEVEAGGPPRRGS